MLQRWFLLRKLLDPEGTSENASQSPLKSHNIVISREIPVIQLAFLCIIFRL